MFDHDRKNKPLCAVNVSESEDGSEYYAVGRSGITAITWGETCGSMAALLTVQVWKNDALHSEHPFINVLGVYYAAPEAPK